MHIMHYWYFELERLGSFRHAFLITLTYQVKAYPNRFTMLCILCAHTVKPINVHVYDDLQLKFCYSDHYANSKLWPNLFTGLFRNFRVIRNKHIL